MTRLPWPPPTRAHGRAVQLFRLAIGVACAAPAGRAVAQGHAAAEDPPPASFAHLQLGSYVPLGALRRGFGPTMLVGIQGSRRLTRNVGAVVSLSAAQLRDERELTRTEWYLWQYDAGLEASAGHAGRLRHPAVFAGAGVGGRTYNLVGPERGARSALAAYVATGAEVRARRTGFRLESRMYLARPGGQPDGRAARTDLDVTAGLAYHFR